jgi:transcriptional regulator GlxA family with amidase domain
MRKTLALWIALGLLAVLGGGASAWIAALPPAPPPARPPPIAAQAATATVAALKPPKRARPLVAVIGLNDATETTDYLMPLGILRRADVAEVVALATAPGPVELYPALRVQPDATVAQFEARRPKGADYVIVPAMSRNDDAEVLAFIRRQAAGGATIVGICAGATVVAEAGLLDGRQATTHWWYLDGMLKAHPTIRYVADRRFVVDRGVATTTGVSASMPMSLTLVEAIAGRAKAQAVARELGLADWNGRHDSSAFRFSRPFALTVIGARAAVWTHEQLGMALAPGLDEVALALVADAWSRTYRSRAVTLAAGPVTSRSGVRILPDRPADGWGGDRLPASAWARRPAQALDGALAAIADRYGARTADVVAMQLEYPRRRAG